ncbi:MAG: hypothetical protein OXE93_08605 [bacterium]|nr:hypothetical protein [bacterium]
MTYPVTPTAAMTTPADQPDPSTAGIISYADADVTAQAAIHQGSARREISLNTVAILFGGIVTALFGGIVGLMMWQFSELGDRIDANGARIEANSARIDNLGTELRAEIARVETSLRAEMQAEIGSLRSEMQAGFAEINAVLLDHTDRLARIETALGLPRPVAAPASATSSTLRGDS